MSTIFLSFLSYSSSNQHLSYTCWSLRPTHIIRLQQQIVHFNEFYFLSFLKTNSFTSFQGFSQQNMTPLEAVGVIQCCSHRLNRKITPEDIQSGILKTLLQPEDYLPLKDVSISKTFYLGVPGFSPESLSFPFFSIFLDDFASVRT